MIVKPLSAETTLTANTTVSLATVVRLYNSGSGAHVITNVDTGNSFTMPGGSISFMVKSPTDEVSTDGTGSEIKATSIAYTVS